jgi:hypothetical protein
MMARLLYPYCKTKFFTNFLEFEVNVHKTIHKRKNAFLNVSKI